MAAKDGVADHKVDVLRIIVGRVVIVDEKTGEEFPAEIVGSTTNARSPTTGSGTTSS
jgi:hypothetical protein